MSEAARILEQSGEAADAQFSSQPADRTLHPCTERELTWVDFELIDNDGQPLPNRKVRLTLPDGRVLEGVTDANGLFGADAIDPGQCKFEALDMPEDQCEMVG